MKKFLTSKTFIIIYSIVLIASATYIVVAQEETIDINCWSKKSADSFIKLHPDTVAYPTEAKSYRWNYEQGLILEAFYRWYKHTGDQKYFNYIKKNIDYYVEDDGNIKTYNMNDFNIDNVSPGRVLIHLYNETGNEKYKKAADTLKHQMLLHPRTNEGGYWHKKIYPYQMWLDGLFMAEPFLAYYALVFNHPEKFDDIIKQYALVKKYLRDEKTGLYYHGYDESKKQEWADKETGQSPNFWGRAIGWFMMSIVDVLDYLPVDHKDRKELISILNELSESLLIYRDDKTKLWYQVVDQGSRDGNYIEASSSMMFIYAFAKGANKSYLNKKFFTIADESFKSAIDNLVTIDKDGLIYLNHVCSVGGLGGKPYRDGSFDYYISEPQRVNDFKGYGPFMFAAMELESKSCTH
ncbi:MAG: glycoside hydrolase family 88 protein [Ignavibacteriales bacterium]|nr:MAG: glycoside hydrolase family 88 protein [Ignavibacteriales bacterium]